MKDITSCADQLVQKLQSLNSVLTTIESCTGGLIAHLITNIPKATRVFWGGRIVYQNSAKIALGISDKTIKIFNSVSEPIALELAKKGLLELKKYTHFSHFICVSTTGVADPQKENQHIEGGMCWIGIASTMHNSLAHTHLIKSAPHLSREETKLDFAQKAIEIVENQLNFVKDHRI